MQYLFVFVWILDVCACLYVQIDLCVPVHSVCMYLFIVCVFSEQDTMKWVAERAPPTIKALNGQPEVPVSV